jgi:hypothetical protein
MILQENKARRPFSVKRGARAACRAIMPAPIDSRPKIPNIPFLLAGKYAMETLAKFVYPLLRFHCCYDSLVEAGAERNTNQSFARSFRAPSRATLVIKPLRSRVAPRHKVVLNGKKLETKFISSTELQAVVDAQTIEHAGLFQGAVVSPEEPGGVSNRRT